MSYAPDLDRAVLESLSWTPEKTEPGHTTDDLRAWHRLAQISDAHYAEVDGALDDLAAALQKGYDANGEYPTSHPRIEQLTFHRLSSRTRDVDLGIPYAYNRFDLRDAYVHRRRGDTERLWGDSPAEQNRKRETYADIAAEGIEWMDWCRENSFFPDDLRPLREKLGGASAVWGLMYQAAYEWRTPEMATDPVLMKLDPNGEYFGIIRKELAHWTKETGKALGREARLINAITRRYRTFRLGGLTREQAARLLGADGDAHDLVALHNELGAEYMEGVVRIGRWTADWAQSL